MMMFQHRLLHTLLASLALLLAAELRAGDKEQERIDRRSGKIATSIRNVQLDENSKIPARVMQQAKGIIILKQYEAGVIFGAKGGFGIAMKRREDGSWGPPAWIKTGEISGGLQLGIQKLNVILVIAREDGLSMLDKPKFQIGVDATVTRGPTGSSFEAHIGDDADLLAYTEFQGYYAGATFDGGFLLPDRRSNQATYGERFSVPEILNHPELEQPSFAEPIVELLSKIENDLSVEKRPAR